MARVAEDVNLSKDESAMVALLDLNVAKFDGTYVVIDPKVRTKHRKAARYTGSDMGELLKQVVSKRDFDVVNAARTVKLGSNLTIASDLGTVTGGQDSTPNGVDNVVSFPTLSDSASSEVDALIQSEVPKRYADANGEIDRSRVRVLVEPNTIVDPILDDTGVRVRAPKKEKAKRRDNRYIRAGRFLVENPSITPAQLSKKADLSYPTAKYTMEAFKAAAFVFAEHKVTVAELRNIANTIEK